MPTIQECIAISDKSYRDFCPDCSANLTPHDGGEDGRHDSYCPRYDGKKVYEVTYVVKARVEAFHESEAGLVGECAMHLPGSWSTPPEPVHHEGALNGWRAKADMVWSMPVAMKEVSND